MNQFLLTLKSYTIDSSLLSQVFLFAQGVTATFIFVTLAVVRKSKIEREKRRPEFEFHEKKQPADLGGQIQTLQSNLDKANKDYTVFKEQAQSLIKERSVISEELLRQKETTGLKIAELEQLKKENADLKNRLESERKEAEKALSSAQRVSNEELKKKDEQLQALEKEKAQALSEVKEISEQLNTKDKTQQALEKDKEEVLSKVKAIEEAAEKKDERLKALEEENSKKSSKLEEFEAEVARYKKEIELSEANKAASVAARAEIEQLRRENTELKEKLTPQEREQQGLQLQGQLDDELKKKSERLKVLEVANKDMGARLLELEAEVARYKKEIDELLKQKGPVEISDEELQQLRKDKEQVVSEIKHTNEQLNQKDEQLQALEKENRELNHKLGILEQNKEVAAIAEGKLEQLKKENADLKNRLESERKEAEKALSSAQRVSNEELKKKDEQLQALEKEIEPAKQKEKILSETKEAVEKSKQIIRAIEAELEKAKKEKAQALSEVKEISEQLNTKDKTQQALEKDKEEVLSKVKAIEEAAEKKDERLKALEEENSKKSSKLEEFEAEVARYKKEIELSEANKAASVAARADSENLKKEISELKKELTIRNEEYNTLLERNSYLEKELKRRTAEKIKGKKLKQELGPPEKDLKKKKLEDILLANNLITREVLDKALEYQKQYGLSITQYLLHYGYVDENQLAECICVQFGIPYLPLTSYDIPREVIELVPVDIAEKYWLIPVDKQGETIMVVMFDPVDNEAIKTVEEVTGLKVIPFVGIISEIASALEAYYKILIPESKFGDKKTLPFFVDTRTYSGIERRRSIRFKTKIDIQFPAQGEYKKGKTKDISRDGMAFESDKILPVGAVLPIEINLPEEYSDLPISAVIQVVRSSPVDNDKFEINARIKKISKKELAAVIEYASVHGEEDYKT